MNAIEIENLNLYYGKCTVIENLNLQIKQGAVCALSGPSGCGKSSLLHSINRMTDLIPECRVEGEIKVEGQSVFDSRLNPIQLRRDVGMVFQQPTPFPVSIARNLTLPLRELGLTWSDVDSRMESALQAAGLWNEVKDRLKRSALELSGGQQQRLCIARALALRPKVLLMDEPCSALDAAATEVVEQTIESLAGQMTIVIATHNKSQAERLARQSIELTTLNCC